MKALFLTALFFLFISCYGQPCPEGINRLPMYGNIKKCKEQLDADKEFLKICDQTYSSRSEASKAYVQMAWDYAYKNDKDTAIKRFNQAWLLDSLNADVYWGFGIIVAVDGKQEESIEMFKKSLELNPENSDVWYCLAISYNNMYSTTQNSQYKEEMFKCLDRSLKLNPNNYNAIRLLQSEKKSDNEETVIIEMPSQ